MMKIIILFPKPSTKEVENLKQVARKGTFICPYCKAQLYVKSGEKLGNFFSHYHGESWEPSKQSESRLRKYEEQKKNDTPRQTYILALITNELSGIAKIYPNVTVTPGYLNKDFSKHIPDLTLKNNNYQYAIMVFTNITTSTDRVIAKFITKQKNYYTSLEYEPLFFVERNQLAIDIDRKSLVLWHSELQALSSQKADIHWTNFLYQLGDVEELQSILKLPSAELNVKSIMYITPANEAISIEVFRVLEHPNTIPPKAHFFAMPYKLTLAQAFAMKDEHLILADLNKEKTNQVKYAENFADEKEAFERKLEEETRLAEAVPIENRKQAPENKQAYLDRFNQGNYVKADKATKKELLMKAFNSNK